MTVNNPLNPGTNIERYLNSFNMSKLVLVHTRLCTAHASPELGIIRNYLNKLRAGAKQELPDNFRPTQHFIMRSHDVTRHSWN